MNVEHLITMANQIGDFFSSYPDKAQAQEDIAHHIQRFWAHSMRQQIVRHVNERQGEGLSPIVAAAIKEHASLLD
ncbi:MAG TPA: formate dehydrogenase subunit delta [Methylophilaceae bacterium]|nr:formate dehydrogenase subunit delta [Methylophilaceae bacterium]